MGVSVKQVCAGVTVAFSLDCYSHKVIGLAGVAARAFGESLSRFASR